MDFTLIKPPDCGPVWGKPKVFTHNEQYKGYFAWVCRYCGIVRLEEDSGPARWFCDICQMKNRLSTGPLPIKEDKK